MARDRLLSTRTGGARSGRRSTGWVTDDQTRASRTAQLRFIRVLLWVLLAAWGVTLVSWLFVSYLRTRQYVWDEFVAPVTVTLNSTRFLPPNEYTEMHFQVDNPTCRDVEVHFLLRSMGSPLVWVDADGDNVLFSGQVPSGTRSSVRFNVLVPFDLWSGQARSVLGRSARLSLWGSVGAHAPPERIDKGDIAIMIAHIPRVTATSEALGKALLGIGGSTATLFLAEKREKIGDALKMLFGR